MVSYLIFGELDRDGKLNREHGPTRDLRGTAGDCPPVSTACQQIRRLISQAALPCSLAIGALESAYSILFI